MRTLIANGTIVTAEGSYQADVLVDGETIAAIGRRGDGALENVLTSILVDETIDATGKYVIPGGIDVHTHMELPFGGTFAKDTFETGTRAAAFGGTTSIVDFAVQSKGQALRAGLDTWMAKAEGNAVTDYGFHMIMSDVNDETLAEMDQLVAEGVPDFKLFTAYPGVFFSPDDHIFRAMQQTAEERRPDPDARRERAGDRRRRRPARGRGQDRPLLPRRRALPGLRGRGDQPRHPAGRGGRRPGLHRPPVRGRRARTQVREARDRGAMAFAETCPQYLFLSLDDLGNGFDGAKFVCSPPLREKDPNWDELWNGAPQERPPGRVHGPLPVRLPRPEGARPGRLPQGPERPAGRRGPRGPAATTAVWSAAGSARSAGWR